MRLSRLIIEEYGLRWVINRMLYILKIKSLKHIPKLDVLFEKQVLVKKNWIFNINTNSLTEFYNTLPENKKKVIIKEADNAVNGIIRVFSSQYLNYGNPIRWNYNPITKQSYSTLKKWFMIPDFDPEKGDVKIVWELSRFTHFYLFARAYMITKDKKYYIAFSSQLKEWINRNQYSYGVNYKCGQECALRMINALMAYSVFYKYKETNECDNKNISKLIEDSYKKILSNYFYAHKCIKNNHTLSETAGMLIGAWCCEDKIQQIKACKYMDKEIIHQFLSDGGYKQYSFNYQRFALQIIECVNTIYNQIGLEFSEASKRRVKNSIQLLYHVQSENGQVPNYGSNDGAHIFPLSVCEYNDYRPIINSLSIIFNNRRLYDKGDYDEELLWFDSNDSKLEPCIKNSIYYKESGYYILRNEDSFMMIVLQNYISRPAHMDQMHIDFWYKDINILCDSGTYSYADGVGNHLMLTGAHNTIKVKAREQMCYKPPFFIYNWSKSKIIKERDNNIVLLMISRNGYKHTRQVLTVKSGYEVIDSIDTYVQYQLLFHTVCNVKVFENIVILSMNEVDLYKLSVSEGTKISIRKCIRSLYYYNKEEINLIVLEPTVKRNVTKIEKMVESD